MNQTNSLLTLSVLAAMNIGKGLPITADGKIGTTGIIGVSQTSVKAGAMIPVTSVGTVLVKLNGAVKKGGGIIFEAGGFVESSDTSAFVALEDGYAGGFVECLINNLSKLSLKERRR